MTKPRTKFPYYKVQSHSDQQCSWVNDRKEAFDSLEDAQAYIYQQQARRRFRIMLVEEKGRRVLEL
jgi:hypothetical protein